MTRFQRSPVVGAIVAALLAVGARAQAATWYQYNGHSYSLSITTGTWSQTEAEAEQDGGNLATVNDAGENAWLYSTFGPLVAGPNYIAWIGFYDPIGNDGGGTNSQHAANFIWASGEPVTYTNWTTNQPDNSNSHENWAITSYGGAGTWNDFSPTSGGYRSGGYQGIIAVVPEPGSLALLGVGAAALVLRRRSRR